MVVEEMSVEVVTRIVVEATLSSLTHSRSAQYLTSASANMLHGVFKYSVAREVSPARSGGRWEGLP